MAPAISRDMRTLLAARLRNQKLTSKPTRATAGQLVSWFGAVQAQEYPLARWGLGQRAAALTDAGIERAFDAGQILRTHVLRPTWHFVTPADIRWMLALTGPRIKAAMAFYDRQLGLDAKEFIKSQTVISRALSQEPALTRAEIGARLESAGIRAATQRLGHLMMRAELDGLVSSGPRRGRQFTYALLDTRAPAGRPKDRDAAVTELVQRYFTSHGPATLRDFSWWSGLTIADGKAGLTILGSAMERREVDGRGYWFAAGAWPTRGPRTSVATPVIHLLPIYDEDLIAYKDREPVVTALAPSVANARVRGLPNQVLLNGLLAGSWGRVVAADAVEIVVSLFQTPSRVVREALYRAVDRHGVFMSRRVSVSVSSPMRQSP